MHAHSLVKRYAYATVASVMLMGAAAKADDLPAYMQPITGRTAASAADIATKDMLALNTEVSSRRLRQIFQRNILIKLPSPRLFSGAGGGSLYRPTLRRSCPQSRCSITAEIRRSSPGGEQVVGPYLDNPPPSWRGRCCLRSLSTRTRASIDADAPSGAQQPHHLKTPRLRTTAWRKACIAFAAVEKFGSRFAFPAHNIAWSAHPGGLG